MDVRCRAKVVWCSCMRDQLRRTASHHAPTTVTSSNSTYDRLDPPHTTVRRMSGVQDGLEDMASGPTVRAAAVRCHFSRAAGMR